MESVGDSIIMGTIIFPNNKIETDVTIDKDIKGGVAYLGFANKEFKIDENQRSINIHNDIIINDNNHIILKIPYLKKNKKKTINGIIKDGVLISDFHEDNFIEFLKEKITLHREISEYIILLHLFQYLALSYIEELLTVEGKVDNLFEEAVYEGNFNMKEVIYLKKFVSLIKRYTEYYKSMVTYMDDEFEGIRLYDKVLFVIDNAISLVENVEASIYSCLDLYNSISSNKMNKTMQVLTIITVLSLPLTAISGLFGMNFEYMPLLKNYYGFFIIMAITFIIVVIEIHYFRKNKFFK